MQDLNNNILLNAIKGKSPLKQSNLFFFNFMFYLARPLFNAF
jgi:hypothetical protein